MNALFIVWDLSHSPRQYVPSKVGQLNLFGPAEEMDPPKKMRVDRFFRPPRFSGFVPREKSVPLGSLVYRAYTDGAASGWEDVEIGSFKGRCFVEVEATAVGDSRRVISLFHLAQADA